MISRIGKYNVEAELGRGGFGQVYKAWDPDVRQWVAIKVMLAQGDPDLLKRFRLEVVTTASLHHKNIVTIYSSGEEDGTPYLVMEFLEGQNLSQIIKERIPLSLLKKVRIMTQVAEGLAFAHSKGVVHRDVKPANIMLLPDGSVKIMDFGIALVPDRRTVSMTMDGFVLGTAPYMSPEQFTTDCKASEQTDIFSFGDVYYELLTGRHPFEPFLRDLSALRVAILAHEPAAVSEVVPECPEALELLVHRSIAKEREFRYQTFEELRLDSAAVLVDLQQEQAAAIMTEARRLMATGELQEARSKVREAQQFEPGNREARQLLEAIDQRLHSELNRERVATRLAEAEKYFAERRFAEAVRVLETAARLDSGNVAVQTRLADAKSKLDSAVLASRLVEEARSKQGKGELPDALERLDQALQADPGHSEARRLRPKITEQLARRRRDQVKEDAMRTASEHLARKEFDQAAGVLDALEQEYPGVSGVAELRDEIELQSAAEERRVRAERFNLAVARTRETMQAGDLERADKMLDYLTNNFSSEPGAPEVLSLLRERLDALVRTRDIAGFWQRADELIRKKRFHEASRLLAEALNRYPDDAGLARQKASADALDEARVRSESVAAVLTRANGLRQSGDLEGALSAIMEARKRLGEDSAFTGLSQELAAQIEHQNYTAGLQDLLETVGRLMERGEYRDAVDRITRAKEYAGEAEVADVLISARKAAEIEEEREVVAAALQEASRLERAQDRNRAVAILEDARSSYPHNAELFEALDRLREDLERERRSESIAKRRAGILREIETGRWKKAQAAVHQAQADFPGESAFEELAGRVEAGLREGALQEAVSSMRAKLTANDVPEASRQLADARSRLGSDERWREIEQEIERRRAYETVLEDAVRRQSEGSLDQAEALLTGIIANAPDLRATRMFSAIRDQREEDAASARHIRECLARDEVREAAEKLKIARAKSSDERLWNALESEISAKRESLERQQAIAQSIRECVNRNEIGQAAARLAEARSQYQNDALWTTLHAEIEARETLQKLQAEVALIGENVRGCLQRGDVEEAAVHLGIARKNHPAETVWAELEREIDVCRKRQILEDSIRRSLEREDPVQAAKKLMAARRLFPDQKPWDALQREIDALSAAIELHKHVADAAGRVRDCLRQEELQQAAWELRGALAKYPNELIWTTLGAEINACQQALTRRAEIEAAANAVREHLQGGDIGTATLQLEAARSRYPEAGLWVELQREMDALEAQLGAQRKEQQRAQAVAAAVDQVRQLLDAERFDEALAAARASLAKFPAEPPISELLRVCEDRARQQEIRHIQTRAESLLTQGRPQEAADLIESRHRAEPALLEALSRARRELDRQRCRNALLAVEQQLDGQAGKRRLRQLDREAENAAAPYNADEEIAAITARIHAGIQSLLAAPGAKQPILTKWRVAGGAAAAAVVGLLVTGRMLNKPTTVPVEIRTDPPGAMVRLNDRSCTPPNCRLDVRPGRYELTAELNGYVRQHQTVVVDASRRVFQLTLDPLPAPLLPAGPQTAATGTLVVQTHIPGALVYVDGAARVRTDSSGSVSLPLESNIHEVRVEQDGYEKTAPQQVTIAPGAPQTLVFRLLPQPAKLELDGAPKGVEIRIAGTMLGRTDGSASYTFAAPVTPGDQSVEIAVGAQKRTVQQRFSPGETARLEWSNVAPASSTVTPPVAPKLPPPSAEEVERQDWERLGASPDVLKLEVFLQNHSNGAHAGQAKSRIADLVWAGVDQTNIEAVRKFLRENPNNPHRSSAQEIVDQFESRKKQESAKQEQSNEERLKQEAAQKAKQQEQLVLAAVTRLDAAFRGRKPGDVKEVWPTVGQTRFLSSMSTPRTQISLSNPRDIRLLQADQATVTCDLEINSSGRAIRQKATLTLRNSGGAWVVESLRAE